MNFNNVKFNKYYRALKYPLRIALASLLLALLIDRVSFWLSKYIVGLFLIIFIVSLLVLKSRLHSLDSEDRIQFADDEIPDEKSDYRANLIFILTCLMSWAGLGFIDYNNFYNGYKFCVPLLLVGFLVGYQATKYLRTKILFLQKPIHLVWGEFFCIVIFTTSIFVGSIGWGVYYWVKQTSVKFLERHEVVDTKNSRFIRIRLQNGTKDIDNYLYSYALKGIKGGDTLQYYRYPIIGDVYLLSDFSYIRK